MPNLAIAQLFNVKVTKIDTDTTVMAVADFGQHFFCLQKDRTLLRVDTATMKVFRQPVTIQTLKDIYRESDTLFGVTHQDSLYYFDGDDFQFAGRKAEANLLYKDAEYKVMGSCSGEWGGSVYFVNRQTGKTFVCNATCPIMVNKLNTGYIVTASLAHLTGSTEILEISSPDQMKVHNFKPPKRKVINVGDNESRSKQGVKVLVDSVGIFTIGSFLIEGEMLHVVTNQNQTFICRIVNRSFEIIQQISNKSLWSYRPACWYGKDGTGFSFFQNHESNGLMRIAGRDVHIYLFQNKSVSE